MNNQITLQDAAKIIDRLGRYFPMLVRNGSEVVNDWYPFIAQFPLDVAQAAAMYVIENTAFDPPKPAVFVQAARMLLQHQTGQRELTAAEAWHAACKQLNPYKKPHYENKLVSQAVHDIGYLNLCTAEHDMFSRFEHVYNILLQREKDEFKIESTLASIGLYQSNIAKIEAIFLQVCVYYSGSRTFTFSFRINVSLPQIINITRVYCIQDTLAYIFGNSISHINIYAIIGTYRNRTSAVIAFLTC